MRDSDSAGIGEAWAKKLGACAQGPGRRRSGRTGEQNNDLFGSTVQFAARLCNQAQPEQILVSNAIAELCIGKGLSFEDIGEVTLKGFGSPVRAHAAAWRL